MEPDREGRGNADHDESGQSNSSGFVPITPAAMTPFNDLERALGENSFIERRGGYYGSSPPSNDLERALSENSFIERRAGYYGWMGNRVGNGGGAGGACGGQDGPLARRPRVVGDYQGSLHNPSGSTAMALATATTITMAMTMMDDHSDYSGCRKLPDHLIESVLARLPVQSVFRFRSVCRAWNALLHSATFLKAYLEAGAIRRQNVWFLVVTANLGRYGHRILATYDPQCNNWHRIPLPAPLCNLNPYPTAADGGLVCYFVYENLQRTLYVCNPLTKSLRKLPLVLKTSSHISVLRMVMEDRATSSYKVFVAGMVPGENGNDSLSMEVYDSESDSWSTSGIIPARFPKRRPAYGDGVLYLRCSDQRSLLLAYDLKAGVWAKLHAPLPHTLGVEELVHYQGHVLLVGVLGENYKIESVCIWELVRASPGNVAWKQVDAMPREMFLEFVCDREYFECRDDERVLMKCCQYGDLVLCVAFGMSHRGPFKVLAYDLAQKRWRKVPDSFKARECRTHKFIEGFIYEPRLDVVA